MLITDSQSCVGDAAAIIATVAGLVLWLCERHDAGELPAPAASWRIAENRWSAARHGIHGQMIDVHDGRATSTRDQLHRILETVGPLARRFGGGTHIDRAHELAECNGADRQRKFASELGERDLMSRLADEFLDPPQ